MTRLTISQARKLLGVGQPMPRKKKPKYGNRTVINDGFKFDSAKEGRRYRVLKVLEEKGVIQNLQMQVVFVLAEKVKFKNEARAKPALRYLADFVYFRDGQQIVEDVKSKATRTKDTYRIKKHLMMSVHGIEIIEI